MGRKWLRSFWVKYGDVDWEKPDSEGLSLSGALSICDQDFRKFVLQCKKHTDLFKARHGNTVIPSKKKKDLASQLKSFYGGGQENANVAGLSGDPQ